MDQSTNQIMSFIFEGTPVRTAERDGQLWFVANDVCAVLEIVNAQHAVERLDDDERGSHTVATPSGDQEMRVINESGLYNLIFTSRKSSAKRFKRWVTAEVLPSIRKTGAYVHPSVADRVDPPDHDTMKRLIASALQSREARSRLPDDLDDLRARITSLEEHIRQADARYADLAAYVGGPTYEFLSSSYHRWDVVFSALIAQVRYSTIQSVHADAAQAAAEAAKHASDEAAAQLKRAMDRLSLVEATPRGRSEKPN